MIAEEVMALLKRVRAGSLDAEHDIAEEIARLDFAFGSACEAIGRLPRWQPIATAPVPPPTEVGNTYTYRFHCLLQLKNDAVVSGFGAYMRPCATALVERLELRWYNDRGRRLHGPKYWMPLPAPKVET